MNPGLLTLLSFLAAVFAVLGIYSIFSDLFLRDRSRVAKRVDEEFRERQREQIRKTSLFKGDLVPLAMGITDDEKLTARQEFVNMVDQSGLAVTPQKLVTIMVGASAGLAALGFLVRQNIPVAVIGAILGLGVPYFYVAAKRAARLNKMTKQLPDAFDLMARVVRAGQTMPQAFQAVAEEFDQPLAGEFTYCIEQQNLGLSSELSLRDLAKRTGLLEIKIFVLALVVQQQSGGNLAEILDKLAHTIRERARVKAKIQALTAEGRLQALVLLVIPIALMGFMTVANEAYASSLMKHPGILIGMLISEGIGALWIRKIVNFDY